MSDKKPVWIAGIARGHNAGVCLLKDGEAYHASAPAQLLLHSGPSRLHTVISAWSRWRPRFFNAFTASSPSPSHCATRCGPSGRKPVTTTYLQLLEKLFEFFRVLFCVWMRVCARAYGH